jgi:hypothetical protein
MSCSVFPECDNLEVETDADTMGLMPAAQATRATLTEIATTWNDVGFIRELLTARTE